ncbi:MAG: MarR family transcriptional regulator, partial [Candidatus Hodarchaeota archaeon]
MKPLTINKKLEKYFFILYKIAEIGGRGRTVKASTKFLAKKIGVSQQTISRYLIELERIELIKRTSTRDGSLIKI